MECLGGLDCGPILVILWRSVLHPMVGDPRAMASSTSSNARLARPEVDLAGGFLWRDTLW